MRSSHFKNYVVAFLFLAPQLIVTLIFFLAPAFQAVVQSLYQSDPFGFHHQYVGLKNYLYLLSSPIYRNSIGITLSYSLCVTFSTLMLGLIVAYVVSKVKKFQGVYKTFLIWPYAVAPAVAAILWRFMFNPSIGWGATIFDKIGFHWNYLTNAKQAFFLIVLTSCWQQFSYNFLFYFAAINALPKSLLEAASLDGASSMQKLVQIIFPMLSPTTFYLFIINLIYAFFDTFGVIQVLTQGGPGRSTSTLVYKVYNDGFIGLDYGGSSAQSVLLMIIISALMFFQFKFVDKKVHY